MWRTLACLVAAMTGTSVLLGWMGPSPSATADAPSPDEIVRLARMAVGVDGGIELREERWNDIEIVTVPDAAVGRSLLAAGSVSGGPHFHVDLSGRPFRVKRWSDQAFSYDSSHTVRIQVARPAGRQLLSPAQWLCVRALASSLNEALAPSGASLPTHLLQPGQVGDGL